MSTEHLTGAELMGLKKPGLHNEPDQPIPTPVVYSIPQFQYSAPPAKPRTAQYYRDRWIEYGDVNDLHLMTSLITDGINPIEET
jgi:hypothetical protein